MADTSNRRHVFISHHHADDASVQGLQDMLKRSGHDVRNSSIRKWKPENQERWKSRTVKKETIERLLRMKMKWAKTVVVLIGKHTHERPWVNWEIKEAHRLGKRIVGVYERGGTLADLPSNFNEYSDALVGWNSGSIMGAIDGECSPFENPDSSPRSPVANPGEGRSVC